MANGAVGALDRRWEYGLTKRTLPNAGARCYIPRADDLIPGVDLWWLLEHHYFSLSRRDDEAIDHYLSLCRLPPTLTGLMARDGVGRCKGDLNIEYGAEPVPPPSIQAASYNHTFNTHSKWRICQNKSMLYQSVSAVI